MGLQLGDAAIELFAEGDPVELVQHRLVETLADAVGLRALGLGPAVIDVLDGEIELEDASLDSLGYPVLRVRRPGRTKCWCSTIAALQFAITSLRSYAEADLLPGQFIQLKLRDKLFCRERVRSVPMELP